MRKGFTLIELLIVLAIIGILVAVAVPIITGKKSLSGSDTTVTINGVITEQCLGGYKFVIGSDGSPRQILNEFGKGVPCKTKDAPDTFK